MSSSAHRRPLGDRPTSAVLTVGSSVGRRLVLGGLLGRLLASRSRSAASTGSTRAANVVLELAVVDVVQRADAGADPPQLGVAVEIQKVAVDVFLAMLFAASCSACRASALRSVSSLPRRLPATGRTSWPTSCSRCRACLASRSWMRSISSHPLEERHVALRVVDLAR